MYHTLVILAADGEVAEVTSTFDVRTVATLASLLVPLLVQVITKKTASEGLRAALGALGAVIVTTLAFVIDPGNTVVNWVTISNVFIASLVTVVGSYLAVYKPLGIAGTIAEKTSGFGLGSPPTVETPDKGAEDEANVQGGVEDDMPEDDEPVEPAERQYGRAVTDDDDHSVENIGERVDDPFGDAR